MVELEVCRREFWLKLNSYVEIGKSIPCTGKYPSLWYTLVAELKIFLPPARSEVGGG